MSTSRRTAWKQLVGRSLRIQVRIFLVIFLITTTIMIERIIANHVNSLWALLGFGVGIGFGAVLARSKPLMWDHSKQQVVSSNNLLGLIVILLYLVFIFTKSRIVDAWIDDAHVVGVIGIAITSGVMLGRVWITFRGVRDELVWLGAYRANRAKHLVRRIQVPVGKQLHVYLTNVLDPHHLSIADVVRLYARRWDIELAFKTVKRDLGLHLLWSAKWELILTQLWGVLLIAQIAASLRAQIAKRAGVDLFEVSLTLLVRDLPYLVRDGEGDVIGRIAALPVVTDGYLRPSRRHQPVVPDDLPITPPPDDLIRTREPRYDGRRCGPAGINLRPIHRRA